MPMPIPAAVDSRSVTAYVFGVERGQQEKAIRENRRKRE
jgi:hypothetical protein